MARTILEIQNQIKTTWINSQAMRTLFGLPTPTTGQEVLQFDAAFPATSIESRLVYVVASAIAILENMFDWHKEDVSNIVNNERYGYAGWYQKMALLFRFGDNINYDYSSTGDMAETTLYPTINPDTNLEYTEEELAELQIVKYAFAEDKDQAVLLKVAGESSSNYEPLATLELTALQAYINRIKPAGIVVTVRSAYADDLFIKCTIKINPLILNTAGELISSPGTKPVVNAIKSYINSLNFNGEISHQKLEDIIQSAEGVELVGNLHIEARQGSNSPEEIGIRYTPFSGYMTWNELDNVFNNNSINYEV